MTLAQLRQFLADHFPGGHDITISAHTDCPNDFLRPMTDARRLNADGFAVCPLTGYVWDTVRCYSCKGTGERKNYPLSLSDGCETLACEDCAGKGFLPERDYTRKAEATHV